ncbi:MAG: zinc ribbon domain-containing protein [Microthrixaceae bacterium]
MTSANDRPNPRSHLMPTYDYRCKDCDHEFEIHQSFDEDTLTVCPSCGGSLRKVFGNVGISFKGSGFYKTDSRSKGSSKSASGSGSGNGASGSDGASSNGSDSSSTTKKPSDSGSGSTSPTSSPAGASTNKG